MGKSASSHVDAHVLASYMGAWGVGRGWVAGVVWSSAEATMWMRTCGGGRREVGEFFGNVCRGRKVNTASSHLDADVLAR